MAASSFVAGVGNDRVSGLICSWDFGRRLGELLPLHVRWDLSWGRAVGVMRQSCVCFLAGRRVARLVPGTVAADRGAMLMVVVGPRGRLTQE